jgi:hypothetical protein
VVECSYETVVPRVGSKFRIIRSLPAARSCNPSCAIHSNITSTVAPARTRPPVASFLESEETNHQANRQFDSLGAALNMLLIFFFLLCFWTGCAVADWPKMSASIAYQVRFPFYMTRAPLHLPISGTFPKPASPSRVVKTRPGLCACV